MNIIPMTIKPYGVEIFSDLERGKQFTTLHYRRRDTSRDKALALIHEVLDDLTRAGLTLQDIVKVKVISKNAAFTLPTAKTRYDCYLEVSVKLLADVEAEDRAFVEALRTRYGHAG